MATYKKPMTKFNSSMHINYLQHRLFRKAWDELIVATPTPSLAIKRQYSTNNLHKVGKNDILFDIIIKELDNGIKKCIFTALNLTTNKIFSEEYANINTSNKNLKMFIATTLIELKNQDIQINSIYIPKRVTSANLTKFIALSFSDVKVVWYLKSDVNHLFKNASNLSFKKRIAESTTLTKRLIKRYI